MVDSSRPIAADAGCGATAAVVLNCGMLLSPRCRALFAANWKAQIPATHKMASAAIDRHITLKIRRPPLSLPEIRSYQVFYSFLIIVWSKISEVGINKLIVWPLQCESDSSSFPVISSDEKSSIIWLMLSMITPQWCLKYILIWLRELLYWAN